MKAFKHLICPICSGSFTKEEQALKCSAGHTYDLASKGYVNLLLSQDKNSKAPGDNKDMAKARKRFLDKCLYEPLAEELCDVIASDIMEKLDRCIFLDAGCGDGYYTNYLKSRFSSFDFDVYGMDISKEAIRLACGRNKDIQFFVASLFRIPLKTSKADFILNAFAPACDEEFSRVLQPDGALITVIPGKRHLFELKSILYENPYENDEKEPNLPSFQIVKQIHVDSRIKLESREDIFDLLTMTPYYWRTPKEGIDRLNRLDTLDTDIDFIITMYKKNLSGWEKHENMD